MKHTFLTPCPLWAEKLAATHPNDLSPVERLALEAHIASCPTCAVVRAEYETVGKYISRLPTVEPLPELPPRLLDLWRDFDEKYGSASSISDSNRVAAVPATHSPVHQPLPIFSVKQHRMRGFAQNAAAIVFVIALVGSFFVLLTSHSSRSGHLGTTEGAWHVIASPSPGSKENTLQGVAAISANDVWAVGSFSGGSTSRTLTEHWNGTEWRVMQSPNSAADQNFLKGVAAISANDVWAVGYAQYNGNGNKEKTQTLIEHWNGTRWSIVQGPNPEMSENLLSAVTAVSANNVWAVGSSHNGTSGIWQTLIEHWDGHTWSMVKSPNPGSYENLLNGVTAVSTNDVWAVGYFARSSKPLTLIEHWDGTAWHVVSSPNAATGSNILNGVAAVSANNVWAVGHTQNGSGNKQVLQALIGHWNGTTWQVVPNPQPGTFNLIGVAATSANNVWAVGESMVKVVGDKDGIKNIIIQTLIEHWNGRAWSAVKSPGSLMGITVLSASNAWTVGAIGNQNGTRELTFTEVYR